MIRLVVWLEDQHHMELISLGRSAAVEEDCVLEICGRWLLYCVALRAGEVRLAASLADAVSAPETLLRGRVDEFGWQTVHRLIAAMERNEIRSLCRPIEIGEPGTSDCWVIG